MFNYFDEFFSISDTLLEHTKTNFNNTSISYFEPKKTAEIIIIQKLARYFEYHKINNRATFGVWSYRRYTHEFIEVEGDEHDGEARGAGCGEDNPRRFQQGRHPRPVIVDTYDGREGPAVHASKITRS